MGFWILIILIWDMDYRPYRFYLASGILPLESLSLLTFAAVHRALKVLQQPLGKPLHVTAPLEPHCHVRHASRKLSFEGTKADDVA